VLGDILEFAFIGAIQLLFAEVALYADDLLTNKALWYILRGLADILNLTFGHLVAAVVHLLPVATRFVQV
jgi:hypothetical protein